MTILEQLKDTVENSVASKTTTISNLEDLGERGRVQDSEGRVWVAKNLMNAIKAKKAKHIKSSDSIEIRLEDVFQNEEGIYMCRRN
jgi:hypothetical protein